MGTSPMRIISAPGIAACEEDPARASEEMNLAVTAYDNAEMPLRAPGVAVPVGGSTERRRGPRPPRKGRARDQGPGHRLARALGGLVSAPGFAKIAGGAIETSF